jgi:hypothetical protein
MPAYLALTLLLVAQAAPLGAAQTQPAAVLPEVAQAEPDTQAGLHPADAAFYLRIPDIQALPAAYLNSPWMLLLLDPEMDALVDDLSEGELRVADIMELTQRDLRRLGLDPAVGQLDLDRALPSLKSLSVSLTWPQAIDSALGEKRHLWVTLGRMQLLQTTIAQWDAYFEEYGDELLAELKEEVKEANNAEGDSMDGADGEEDRSAEGAVPVEDGQEYEDALTIEDLAYLSDLSELYVAPETLLDGWGRPFLYEATGASPEGENGEPRRIISLGADGQRGGAGLDADLIQGGYDADQVNKDAGQTLASLVGMELVLEFDAGQVASDLAKDLAAKFLPDATSAQHSAAGVAWSTYSKTLEGRNGVVDVWIAQAGQELVLGLGKVDLPGFLARCAGRDGLGANSGFLQARAGAELPAGQVVTECYQTQSLLRLGTDLMVFIFDAVGPMDTSRQPVTISAKEALVGRRNFARLLSAGFGPHFSRTVLGAGRFTKHRFQPHSGTPPAALIGSNQLDSELLKHIDPEAGMVWAGGADVQGLFVLLCKQMGFSRGLRGEFPRAKLEKESGFSFEADLIGQLEPQAAFAVGTVKGLAPPEMVGYFKAKDPIQLQRGLEGWLRGLVNLDPETFALNERPYRKLPFYELKVQPATAWDPEDVPPPTEFAFGLRDGLLFVSLNSKTVKDELRRELEGDSPWFSMLSDQNLDSGVTEVLIIDQPAYIRAGYALAKGYGALAASSGAVELPFDISLLPEVDLFVRHFQPTLALTRRLPEGLVTDRISSFGPEVPALGTLLSLSALWLPGLIGAAGLNSQDEEPQEDPQAGSVIGDGGAQGDAGGPEPAIESTRSRLLGLRTGLELYHWDRLAYPESLSQLTEPSANYPQGYLKSVELPLDGWGQPFVYATTPAGGFLLRSMGPNGQDDGGGGDDVRVN